jgi:hypothetical protein
MASTQHTGSILICTRLQAMAWLANERVAAAESDTHAVHYMTCHREQQRQSQRLSAASSQKNCIHLRRANLWAVRRGWPSSPPYCTAPSQARKEPPPWQLSHSAPPPVPIDNIVDLPPANSTTTTWCPRPLFIQASVLTHYSGKALSAGPIRHGCTDVYARWR